MKMAMEDVARTSEVSKATVLYVLNQKCSSMGLSSQAIMKVLYVSRRLNCLSRKPELYCAEHLIMAAGRYRASALETASAG